MRIPRFAVLAAWTVLLFSAGSAFAQICTPPAIKGFPSDFSVPYNTSAELWVNVTGSPTLSYQWYERTALGVAALRGGTASTYKTDAVTSSRRFFVQVWNACGKETSVDVVVSAECLLSITRQPQSQSIPSGATAKLSVAAAGTSPFTYQWYNGKSGDTSKPVGSNAATYETPPLTRSTSFWVAIRNVCKKSVSSQTADVTICTPPSISSQPRSQTIDAGSSVTLSVTASGTSPLKYQWYQLVDGSNPKPVGTDAPLFVTPPLASSARFFVNVSNSCDAILSVEAVITVKSGCVAPSITAQPQSQSIVSGSSATISVTAAGTEPLTYQWNQLGIISPEMPVGTNSPVYVTPSLTETSYYYVKIRNECGSVSSVEVTITVKSGCVAPSITAQPLSQSIVSGSSATLSVAASGTEPLTYQWNQLGIISPEMPVGTNSSVYVTPPLTETSYYYVKIKNECGSVSSVEVTITVTSGCVAPSITAQPQSQSIVSGSSATLSVTASGTEPLTYQWNQLGIISPEMPVGTNSPIYVTPLLTETSYYYVKVRNECGSASSGEVIITVTSACTAPSITKQPENVVTLQGHQFTFSVTASGTTPLSYQWFVGAEGDETHPINGAVAPVYSGTASGGMVVWVKVWNSCGSTASGGASLIVGCPVPDQPQIWVDPIAESGSRYTVRVENASGAVRYQISEAALESLTVPEGFVWPPFTELQAGQRSMVYSHANAGVRALYYHYAIRSVCDDAHVSLPSLAYVGVLPIKRPQKLGASLPAEGSIAFGAAAPLEVAKLLITSPASKNALDTTFSISTGAPWLTATPPSGTIPAEGAVVTITADPTSLPVGSTSNSVSVTTGTSTPTMTTMSVNLLTPVTAKPKTAPPPNALIIPAVGHAQGANESMFQSDVRIANIAPVKVRYALTYTPAAQDGTVYGRQTEIEIGAGQTVAVNDVLKNWYCVGLLGESGQGALEIRPLDFSGKSGDASVSEFATVVSSRTYNVTASGTYGQFIPGIPFSQFVGRSAVLSLQQVAQSAAYRTNVGFVEGSGQPADLEIRIISGDGTQLATVNTRLAPAEQRQVSLTELFPGQLTDGRIEVRVTSETGRVTAYASVVDNVTSDPLLVSPVDITKLRSNRYVIPGIGHVDTGGASWRSDLRILNAGSSPINATLLFFPQNSTAPVASRTIAIAAGEVKAYDNASESLFGLKNINGVVHVMTASESSLVVTARTYDQRPSGTYGQFIPGVTPEDSAGVSDRALQLLQIEQSDRFRSHLGVAETTGNPVTLEITALVPETTVVPKVKIPLGANEFRQLPNIMSMLNLPPTYNGRIEVKAIDGTGRATAYISAVDNRTQDPTYIPAQ